jgi:hypothetical protein
MIRNPHCTSPLTRLDFDRVPPDRAIWIWTGIEREKGEDKMSGQGNLGDVLVGSDVGRWEYRDRRVGRIRQTYLDFSPPHFPLLLHHDDASLPPYLRTVVKRWIQQQSKHHLLDHYSPNLKNQVRPLKDNQSLDHRSSIGVQSK